MQELEIKQQINQLEREYLNLKKAIYFLSTDLNNIAYLRGVLSGAGAAAELVLKCIYRKEKVLDVKIPLERAEDLKKQEVEKLMLDELIHKVEKKIPIGIVTHLRTIQAWRNIGSHNKSGELHETVNSSSLQIVSVALEELIMWFIGEYLKLDTSSFNVHINDDPKMKIDEIALKIWRETYWHANKNNSLSILEQAKLNNIQNVNSLLDSDIDNIKKNYFRNIEYFKLALDEASEDGLFDNEELEAIEQVRIDCCISQKESLELLDTYDWKTKFYGNPEELKIDWMRNELNSSNQKTPSTKLDSEQYNKINSNENSEISKISQTKNQNKQKSILEEILKSNKKESSDIDGEKKSRDFVCRYCGKKLMNENAHSSHMRLCTQRRDFLKKFRLGKSFIFQDEAESINRWNSLDHSYLNPNEYEIKSSIESIDFIKNEIYVLTRFPLERQQKYCIFYLITISQIADKKTVRFQAFTMLESLVSKYELEILLDYWPSLGNRRYEPTSDAYSKTWAKFFRIKDDCFFFIDFPLWILLLDRYLLSYKNFGWIKNNFHPNDNYYMDMVLKSMLELLCDEQYLIDLPNGPCFNYHIPKEVIPLLHQNSRERFAKDTIHWLNVESIGYDPSDPASAHIL